MRMILALVAVLYSGAAIAQVDGTPAGDQPVAQAKSQSKSKSMPKSKKPTAAKSKLAAKPQFSAAALQACLDIEDGTKERLDCYDAVIAPEAAPKPKLPKAKSVADCRFVKEQDERLTCFNGFVVKLPKPPEAKPAEAKPPK